MAEAVVDRLEAVEVDEQDRDVAPAALGALESVGEAVAEQRPVGQARQRVMQRLVDHRVDGLRVRQGKARVLGERDQHLAVGQAVPATGRVAGDEHTAHDLAVLEDGRGHRGLQPAIDEHRHRLVGLRVVLGHDQPALGDGAAADALADPAAADLVVQPLGNAHARHDQQALAVVGLAQQHRRLLVAEHLAGQHDDRIEDIVQRRAARDRPLDPREPLEQALALAQGADDVVVAQGQRERPRHGPQKARLDGVQRLVGAGHDQMALALVADRDDQHRRLSSAGHRKRVRPRRGRGGEDRLLGHLVVRPANRMRDRAATDQRDRVGVQRLGHALDGRAHRDSLVVGRRDHRQELGELLRGPVSLRSRHATASTTSVSLWKPVTPRVRAISPYV